MMLRNKYSRTQLSTTANKKKFPFLSLEIVKTNGLMAAWMQGAAQISGLLPGFVHSPGNISRPRKGVLISEGKGKEVSETECLVIQLSENVTLSLPSRLLLRVT